MRVSPPALHGRPTRRPPEATQVAARGALDDAAEPGLVAADPACNAGSGRGWASAAPTERDLHEVVLAEDANRTPWAGTRESRRRVFDVPVERLRGDPQPVPDTANGHRIRATLVEQSHRSGVAPTSMRKTAKDEPLAEAGVRRLSVACSNIGHDHLTRLVDRVRDRDHVPPHVGDHVPTGTSRANQAKPPSAARTAAIGLSNHQSTVKAQAGAR